MFLHFPVIFIVVAVIVVVLVVIVVAFDLVVGGNKDIKIALRLSISYSAECER